jgi:hypothetical protein
MSKLYQRRYLKCPYKRAKELLGGALEAAATSGEAELLRLELPIAEGAAIGKNVLVSFERGSDPMHFDEPWNVRWEPSPGGIYPTFSGTLTIRADDTYDTSMLELTGSYEPPLGLAGAAFDALAGSRIAHGTARELLRRIGGTIEAQYDAGEAQKSASA